MFNKTLNEMLSDFVEDFDITINVKKTGENLTINISPVKSVVKNKLTAEDVVHPIAKAKPEQKTPVKPKTSEAIAAEKELTAKSRRFVVSVNKGHKLLNENKFRLAQVSYEKALADCIDEREKEFVLEKILECKKGYGDDEVTIKEVVAANPDRLHIVSLDKNQNIVDEAVSNFYDQTPPKGELDPNNVSFEEEPFSDTVRENIPAPIKEEDTLESEDEDWGNFNL